MIIVEFLKNRMFMEISESLVLRVLQSDEQFPIDFDNAWQWIGYKKKENAYKKLVNNFEIGIDFIEPLDFASPNGEANRGGHNRKAIYISIDCFKSLAMMAGTQKGKEVRRYFLDCEKRLKQLLSNSVDWAIKDKIISAIVSKVPASPYPKFQDWFYAMLYRKRGNGWENRCTANRPPCVGTWTNKVVYDVMFGGITKQSIKSKLLESEPKINGRRKNPLHSHFTKDFGLDYLERHFAKLDVIDKITPDGDWERFLYNIEKVFPVEGKELQLNLLYELQKFEQSTLSTKTN